MSISDPIHSTVLHSSRGDALTDAFQSTLPFAPGLKGWEQIAACRGIDASIFFPDDEDDNAELAKKICRGCSGAMPCLEYAITERETEGGWGGATRKASTTSRRKWKISRLASASAASTT